MTTSVRSRGARALLFAFFGLLAAPALEAQTRKELGRMWTFEHAPLGWFQQAYDWQPTKEWLDHARLSSLRPPTPQVDDERDGSPAGCPDDVIAAPVVVQRDALRRRLNVKTHVPASPPP